jgi:hypothetical protein
VRSGIAIEDAVLLIQFARCKEQTTLKIFEKTTSTMNHTNLTGFAW